MHVSLHFFAVAKIMEVGKILVFARGEVTVPMVVEYLWWEGVEYTARLRDEIGS